MARKRRPRKPAPPGNVRPRRKQMKSVPKKQRRRRSIRGMMSRLSVIAPVAASSVVRGTTKGDIHFEGPTEELLITVSAPTSAIPGTVLFYLNICPQWLRNSRLRSFSNLYAQYRFTKFWIEIIPAVPTSVGGSICFAIDKDVNANLNLPSDNELAYAMAIDSSFTGPIWQQADVSVDCSSRSNRQLQYLTDGQAETAQAVQFRVLGVVASTLSSTGPYGLLLRMGYTIEFSAPILDRNLTLPVPFGSLPGATYTVGATGILGFSVLTVPGNNGLVCAVNPVLTAGMNAGGSSIGAVIVNTLVGGGGAQLLAFPNVQSCLGSLPSNLNAGTVLGASATITAATAITFYPICFVALGNHT